MPTIQADRLLRDLQELRSFGATGSGVVRPSLSAVDMQARHWLASKMTAAGLVAKIDGIGNVFGRSVNPGKALLVGSHSDTQPTGGWLDGALGVIYAIEAARALREDRDHACLPIDTVAWVDEESTFASCLGSRSFCSMVSDDERNSAVNASGQTLAAALEAAGLTGIADTADNARYLGYLEAHIEQGPYLEANARRIGVVTSIVGSRNFSVQFIGQQNHAGSTPMAMRKDAGLSMMSFGYQINEALQACCGPKSVWTIGTLSVTPGAPSIIPGFAQCHLQMRDPDDGQLDVLEGAVREVIARMNSTGPVDVSMRAYAPPIRPAPMDSGFQQHLADAAADIAPRDWVSMPSAAVHDAMFMAKIMPAGMMFIPSIGGVSHDFSENTSEADIVLGARVFTAAIASILRDANQG
ncbi:MAG: hydantoinase/carbamoylase family amidase [Burkholderiaceae bacterium]